MKWLLALHSASADAHSQAARLRALDRRMTAALQAGDLATAAQHADEYARGVMDDAEREIYVSIPKLQHDLAQLRYLAGQGIRVEDADRRVEGYTQVLDEARADRAPTDRWLITDRERGRIGDFYDRIIYRSEGPRVARALSAGWDPGRAEESYLRGGRGAVAIDDFLTPAALEVLRNFCLESVIWFNNRYAYGRLGTMFARGFNCPLLVQIGEEIAAAFPDIIGPRHHLRQLWAYKNGQQQPATPPHADFAAVNINLWITPDSANLDPPTGGLDVYDTEAPSTWEWERRRRYQSVPGRVGGHGDQDPLSREPRRHLQLRPVPRHPAPGLRRRLCEPADQRHVPLRPPRR